MEKSEAANPKMAKNKQSKSKTKQRPKVVYITNPMKFTAATASEFRSLVQELTGRDADVSGSSSFAAAAKAAEGSVTHAAEEVGRGVGGADMMMIDSPQDYDCMWYQYEDVEDIFKGL